LNEDQKILVNGEPVPSANEEYFLYQTLVGSWPLQAMNDGEYAEFATRIHSYMEKALREAKVNTSWVNPNAEYESAFRGFLDAVLDPSAGKAFLDDLAPFQARIAKAGVLNSLSQTLLKIASPGLPDFYQGTEIWNFSLADPDNRRPVNYEESQALLARLRDAVDLNSPGLVDRLVENPADGALKLHVTRCALQLRCKHRALFAKGNYVPLRAIGTRNKNVIAFARSFRGSTVIVMVGRFFAQLGAQSRLPVGVETWGDTQAILRKRIPPGPYRDVLTGQTISAVARNGDPTLPVFEVFSHLPVALLIHVEDSANAG
jgi:(1->4)-alpha-D-glucan 1-alpha-D-glucosylmutase